MDAATVPGMVTRSRKPAKGHLYIDQWLEAKDKSYESVGAKLGVSRTTVWRWSKEQHRLDPMKQRRLAKAMGLEREEDLYRMPGPKDAKPTEPARPPRPSIDALLDGTDDATYNSFVDLARKVSPRVP